MTVHRLGSWFISLVFIFAAVQCSSQNTFVTARVSVEHARLAASKNSNQDVVVWLEPIDATPVLHPSQTKYRITQRNKQFHPHVLAVTVGAGVEFPNKDPFFHNVFSLYDGERFDLGLYEAGSSRIVHFDRPGVSFIFCNIHPEMNAYVLALLSPYFAVTDPHGDVRIANVVPGRYRLRVWYERAESDQLASLTREIAVSGASLDLGRLAVPESARLLPQHTNKHGEPYDVDRSPYPQ